MAFVDKYGFKVSYECSDLIQELKLDIQEFGGHTMVNVWCKEVHGMTIYTNYDFIDHKYPIKDSEILEGEYVTKMTMTSLLILLEKQNEIM